MSLLLYYHPLSSFCHKALTALYETGARFETVLVDFGNAESRDAFLKVWPIGKFPVLKDSARDQLVPESTIIIEYLAQHYPGSSRLLPADADNARQVRLLDRFYDLNVHIHMQKIVGDRIRPADGKDPVGVEHAKSQIRTALGMIEEAMTNKTWAMGDDFTLADCAAAPALWYTNKVTPFATTHPQSMAYLNRLVGRPSFARVLKEAAPYMHMFPQ
jgi:glutathione S-transferase